MTPDELLKFYEARVRADAAHLASISPGLKDRVYYDGMYQNKVIVRHVKLRADIPICWGAVDCLDYPVTRCSGNQHETCQAHVGSCFLCPSAST